MIAICLLSFALLALAQLQIVAVRDNAFASGMTAAATLAQDKIEELMGQPYASILAGQDNPGQYTRQWNVDNDIPTAGMKRVTVTVSRQNGPTVQMSTVISQP
jgi:Tfp pilus assembly protein PilV